MFDIETRGTAKIETVLKLAAVLELPVMRVFVEAGWISEEELGDGGLTRDEQAVLDTFRSIPPERRPLMIALLETAARESQSLGMIAETRAVYRADPGTDDK